MKWFQVLAILVISAAAHAQVGFKAGYRSGVIDTSSQTVNGGGTSYTYPQTAGYMGGLVYDKKFNNWMGIRTGVEYVQFGYSLSVSGAATGTATFATNTVAVPVQAKIDFGNALSLMLGGYYYTVSSNTCTYTGALSGNGPCGSGNPGSGAGARAELGIHFSPHAELDLGYEPTVQLSPAAGSSSALRINTILAAFVFKL